MTNNKIAIIGVKLKSELEGAVAVGQMCIKGLKSANPSWMKLESLDDCNCTKSW